jgi:hypothetical protein
MKEKHVIFFDTFKNCWIGYVERIVPELTNKQFQMHLRVSSSSFEKFVPTLLPLHCRQIFDRCQI